ncbi:hypothetical protein HGM15179_002944, partial [Zosterops borbonicus]
AHTKRVISTLSQSTLTTLCHHHPRRWRMRRKVKNMRRDETEKLPCSRCLPSFHHQRFSCVHALSKK